MIQLFIEALQTGKISANGIINKLQQTWLNSNAIRRSNGRETSINYLNLIKSGIKFLFAELDIWNRDNAYVPDFVCVTDSLILKGEYLLRECCTLLGIPTFKQRSKNPHLIMEKLLDDILSDLKGHLSEDDYFFIRFILVEKVGFNLRNRVAHGLLDNVDYTLPLPIYALIVILKLSNYQFVLPPVN